MYTVSYPGSGVVRSLVSMMIAVVLGMTSAYANSSVAPDQLISSLFEVINKRLNDDQEKIAADKKHLITIGDEVLAPYVSFETMAKQILGKNWRKITPEQRVRYTEAFRQRVSLSLVSQYDPSKKYLLEVTGSRQNDKGDRAAVSSVVTEAKTGEKYNISYKLYVDRKTKNWQVYDIVVEGVSVLQSFKTASAEDFKNNGIEYMIAQLESSEEPASSAQ
ncbi:MAG: MlaC/ttg2D family ABC transporter substrate-binding protein [Ketobacter sp.]|nr:ABC transporter substrate-binding protein [Pseudomonadota bacterium]